MGDARFRKHPRPDQAIVVLLEHVLQSARQGYVRSISVIAVNPVNLVETASAGDLNPVRQTALLGGLVRAAVELITKS